jgi:hypothetical protein
MHKGSGGIIPSNNVVSGRQLRQGGTSLFAREDFIEFVAAKLSRLVLLFSPKLGIYMAARGQLNT